jgi:hypothetical protein
MTVDNIGDALADIGRVIGHAFKMTNRQRHQQDGF